METVDCCWAGRRNIDLTCVAVYSSSEITGSLFVAVYSKLLIVGGPMSLILGEGSRLEILESGYEYLGVLFHVYLFCIHTLALAAMNCFDFLV